MCIPLHNQNANCCIDIDILQNLVNNVYLLCDPAKAIGEE